jgi:hypothetical protein
MAVGRAKPALLNHRRSLYLGDLCSAPAGTIAADSAVNVDLADARETGVLAAAAEGAAAPDHHTAATSLSRWFPQHSKLRCSRALQGIGAIVGVRRGRVRLPRRLINAAS